MNRLQTVKPSDYTLSRFKALQEAVLPRRCRLRAFVPSRDVPRLQPADVRRLRPGVAVLPVPGDSLQEVHRQPARSGSDICRSPSMSTARSRSGFTPCRSARRSPRARWPPISRAAIRACASFSRRRPCRDSRWRGSIQHVDGVFYFPFDWTFIVRRTLDLVRPRALHHDGDRDLAEPAARVPRARREDGPHQRTHLVALVSALPADPSVLQARAGRRRSVLHAERGVGAPPDRLSARIRRASR